MTEISENIPATSEDLWQFSEDFWTLLKLSEDVPTTSELFWSYFKGKNFSVLWYSWPQIFSGKWNCTFVINHVLKNNLCRFASQAWEVVLDAWDWCLRFADTRLKHEAWELATINAWGYSLIWPTWKCATGQDMVFVLSVTGYAISWMSVLSRVYNLMQAFTINFICLMKFVSILNGVRVFEWLT